MQSASELQEGAQFHMSRGHANQAAFNLHQAAERLYQCLFLVRTLYTPKHAQLNRLRALAEDMERAQAGLAWGYA